MEIREQLSYPNEQNKHECLKKLMSCDSIFESILISTCNRMEVFCNCNNIALATEHIFDMLSKHSGISMEELHERADVFDDSTAIHHIFSVASSLDSMVIGETQIAGQLKDAFRFSFDNGYCGKKLARVMKNAFKCAAKVRNATDISSKPVSIASVAVSKLKSVVDEIKDKKALIIGVGEMSEISAKHLVSAGADVYIMNRTKHKAELLAKACGANVMNFEQLPHAVNGFEIIFTATSSPEPIITDEIIKPRDFNRYWFDLALPRDIQHTPSEKIDLFIIDDLKNIVDENIGHREESSRAAHGIIGRSVVDFFEWLNTLDIEPMIKEIYQKAYLCASNESQRAIEHGYIPKEYEEQAKKMCEQAIKRFLHDTTKKMRSASEDEQPDLLSASVSSMMKDKIEMREGNK